jgi:hypothetical protein
LCEKLATRFPDKECELKFEGDCWRRSSDFLHATFTLGWIHNRKNTDSLPTIAHKNSPNPDSAFFLDLGKWDKQNYCCTIEKILLKEMGLACEGSRVDYYDEP